MPLVLIFRYMPFRYLKVSVWIKSHLFSPFDVWVDLSGSRDHWCVTRLRMALSQLTLTCLTGGEMSDQQGVPDQQVAGKSQGGAGAVYKVQIC